MGIGKRFMLLGSALLGFAGFASLVSAIPDISYVSDSVVRFYQDFFGPIFGALIGDYSSSEFFFAKILVMFLLFFLIVFALKKVDQFKGQTAIVYVIASVVSILAVRFISDNQLIHGILVPYGAFGVSLLTLVPFVLFFYLIHHAGFGATGRRIGWVVYAVVFAGIWISNSDNIPSTLNWIYLVAAVVLAIVFLFDRTIHKYFESWQTSTLLDKVRIGRIARLQAEYLKLGEATQPTPQMQQRMKDLADEIKKANADVPAI